MISDDFADLKQNISFKFQALDFKEAMALMADIGNINILVGDEVAGSITAELDNVPWDKAFNALLDLKSYAADIDVASNIIRGIDTIKFNLSRKLQVCKSFCCEEKS